MSVAFLSSQASAQAMASWRGVAMAASGISGFQGQIELGTGVAKGRRAVKRHHPRKKRNVTTTKRGTRMPVDQSM